MSPALLDQPYDPGNRFSAPARHGAFGFAYRPDTVTDEPASWEDFFALLPRYSRRGIVLLPGRIEPIAAALAAGGADINSDDPDDLDAARTLLLRALPHVNAFSTNPAAAFVPEALVLAMGAASAFARQAPAATFVLPEGGAESWIDAWAVAAASPRPGDGARLREPPALAGRPGARLGALADARRRPRRRPARARPPAHESADAARRRPRERLHPQPALPGRPRPAHADLGGDRRRAGRLAARCGSSPSTSRS